MILPSPPRLPRRVAAIARLAALAASPCGRRVVCSDLYEALAGDPPDPVITL